MKAAPRLPVRQQQQKAFPNVAVPHQMLQATFLISGMLSQSIRTAQHGATANSIPQHRCIKRVSTKCLQQTVALVCTRTSGCDCVDSSAIACKDLQHDVTASPA